MWLLLSACVRPPMVDPGARGPHGIGVTTTSAVDERGRTVKIEVWYPSVPGTGRPGVYSPMTLQLDAERDAEPVPGPWPMIGFSHGSDAVPFQSAFLTEHLASHGFVVAAPEHANNNLFDLATGPDERAQVMLERPGDVVFAVDTVFADTGRLAGMTEPGEWAVVGHSFGALTALIVGGAQGDLDAAVAWCEDNEGVACNELDALEADVLPTGDDRVVATVAMSPFAAYAFGDDGLHGVREPLILGGDRDTLTDYQTEIRPVYEGLGAGRRFLTFAEAGHYAFSDICLLMPQFFEECDPAAGFADLDAVHADTRRAVTAHLLDKLVGDERYAEVFSAEAWQEVQAVSFEGD